MTRLARWGNSLALRLPNAVVQTSGLKDGDDVKVNVAPDGSLRIERDDRRSKALDALGRLGWKLPEGYKFDREEAHHRGRDD